MKIVLLALLLAVTSLGGAEPTYLPQEAIDKFGSFTITDGSSYFTFSKDGKFRSDPMGVSGREFFGRWTLADKTEFTVIARLGWVNGLNFPDEYRRIVFRISSLRERPMPSGPGLYITPPGKMFDSYCLIEELVKIPKPQNSIGEWPNESRHPTPG